MVYTLGCPGALQPLAGDAVTPCTAICESKCNMIIQAQLKVCDMEGMGMPWAVPVAFAPLVGDEDALASTSAAFCVASATSAAAEDWLCWALAAALSAAPAAGHRRTMRANGSSPCTGKAGLKSSQNFPVQGTDASANAQTFLKAANHGLCSVLWLTPCFFNVLCLILPGMVFALHDHDQCCNLPYHCSCSGMTSLPNFHESLSKSERPAVRENTEFLIQNESRMRANGKLGPGLSVQAQSSQ